MDLPCNNINDLITLLRINGDKLLDASSKLSLPASLLYNLNQSFKHKKATNNCDIEFLFDFVQQTFALKILPDTPFWNNEKIIEINLFKNLKLLEIQRLSSNLLKGIKNLRSQLEYITCVRSLRSIGDVLEYCGADNCQGYVWKKLKEAAFNHNCLDSIDNSLEFTPWLQTLDLSHNHIQNVQLSNCLPNLNYLNLSFNQLENCPIISGQLSSHLKILVLSNNFIEDIGDLSTLTNLNELDLSYNCLVDHTSLIPLVNLPFLKWLSLIGNPLSFHSKHRTNTAYYLNFNVTNFDFILDKIILSKMEKQFVGSVRTSAILSRSQLNSVCSTESENTVINTNFKNVNRVPSTCGVSSSSVLTIKLDSDNEDDDLKDIWSNKTMQDCVGMQDSGFVTEPRTTSPAELSIGSATSLVDESVNKFGHCESDIEVISNPSQSSIEVIETCSEIVRFGNLVPIQEVEPTTTKANIALYSEQHRSL